MRLRGFVLLLHGVAMLQAVATHATSSLKPRIHSSVHRTLQRQGTANIMVTMRDSTESIYESLPLEASFTTRGALITDMVDKLQAHAKTSQAEIEKLLVSEASEELFSETRSLWISNQVYFRDATFVLVEKLAALSSVSAIEEERVATVSSLADVAVANVSSRRLAENGWALTKLQAKEVWAKGITGQGVVVGVISTGVRGTHDSVRGNFRKDFGWYDPTNKTTAPYDASGGGTVIVAGAVGWREVGVAPGAAWIACKACGAGQCGAVDILSCAEFMTCPTDPSGISRDCSKAPNIVATSYADPTGVSDYYLPTILAWRRAGIIPISPASNTGPNCGTIQSSGPYVISVGATTSSDGLTSFSSRGPTPAGLTKPDLVSPGENVLTPARTDDTGYVLVSSAVSSVAYVAGVVALMLSSEPTLAFEQVRQKLLSEGTDQATLLPADEECGGTPNGQFPNNMYGYGRVNALKAVNSKRVPVAGQCTGLGYSACDSTFFCMWSNVKQTCQSWW